jgi:ATP-dependent DNA ligase
MQLIFDFCLPTKSTSVPDGPDWLQEIKFDGYRLSVERNGDRVRLITKGGYDWTKRFFWGRTGYEAAVKTCSIGCKLPAAEIFSLQERGVRRYH